MGKKTFNCDLGVRIEVNKKMLCLSRIIITISEKSEEQLGGWN